MESFESLNDGEAHSCGQTASEENDFCNTNRERKMQRSFEEEGRGRGGKEGEGREGWEENGGKRGRQGVNATRCA